MTWKIKTRIGRKFSQPLLEEGARLLIVLRAAWVWPQPKDASVVLQSVGNNGCSSKHPVHGAVGQTSFVFDITTAHVGMDAWKPNLLKVQVVMVVPLVELFRRRRPSDSGKVSAIFVDRYRVFGVVDVYVQRRVIELVLGSGEVQRRKPFEDTISRQRRRDFQVVFEIDQNCKHHAKIAEIPGNAASRRKNRIKCAPEIM